MTQDQRIEHLEAELFRERQEVIKWQRFAKEWKNAYQYRPVWGDPTPELVKDWYRQLSKRYHSDCGGTDVEQAVVNEAYTLLKGMLK